MIMIELFIYLKNILMNHKQKKYFDKKSVHNIWSDDKKLKKEQYDFIVSIPCYDEYDYIFKTLESINNQNIDLLKNTLVSIVINNSESEKKEVINNNIKTFEKLILNEYNFEFIAIDAFSKNKSIKDKDAGVGMARKISVDIALQYCHTNTMICFIDADTKLSERYLKSIRASYIKDKWEAATIDFKHLRDEPKTIELINDYENFLKNTSENLKKSNSPYHYVPLGSTMLCTKDAYISIGGMNKRKAAEDFYFLQELQKSIGVFYINEVLAYPSSRYLNRSYLGTSTRLKKSLDGELDINTLYYSSKSFEILYLWIETALNSEAASYQEIVKKCNEIDLNLSEILISLNFEKAWEGIIDTPSYQHFEKQFHRWFDAFKTFKLLKYYS